MVKMGRRHTGVRFIGKALAVASALAVLLFSQSMKQTEADGVKDKGRGDVVVAGVIGGGGFADMSTHWAAEQVKIAVQKGYVNGYEDGTFRPDKEVTRAEFVKLVATALGVPVSGSATGSDWYVLFVNAAVGAGLHQWSDFTTGDWNTPMTRYEMARLAVRAVGEQNIDAKKWMYLATKAGLIQGMDDTGTLAEDGTTTRAQAVTIIERILAVKASKTLPVDKHAVSRAEVVWHGTNIFTMWPRYFSNKIEEFDISKFQWDSSDGIYHEEVMYFVVVDNEDPNDPFRAEVEGFTFGFYKYDENGRIQSLQNQTAPSKSYVTFSKVKQEVKGQYPKNLWTTGGGRVYVDNLLPKDAMENPKLNWKKSYSDQESDSVIYFTKDGGGYPEADWNTQKGNTPYYVKDMPAEGGTYYWVSAQVHPKGDYFSVFNNRIFISYTPNLYYMKNYGPDYGLNFMSYTDYTKNNE